MSNEQLAVFISQIIGRLRSDQYESDAYKTFKDKYVNLSTAIDNLVEELRGQVKILTGNTK